jgi:hypothetical protein
VHRETTPDVVNGLRAYAASLPPGTAVPVAREVLLELLEARADPPASAADPTVEVIATRYGRVPSTVRGWCELGRFPGAYKLSREWRIPAAAVEAFDAALRARPARPRRGPLQSLSDWRHAS